MEVTAHDPFLDGAAFGATRQVDSLDGLLGEADVVSVHIPLTEENTRLFDAAMFSVMKPGVVFVNTARGGLVDQEALLAALDSGQVRSAGLDVTDPEPLPGDHPLLHRDDVVVTPHVASGTIAGKVRIFRMALAQVIDVWEGRRPTHLLNHEVWETVERRVAEERA